MKVLFIGCWKDGTGWGNVAQNYILALDSVGVDVVPRAVKLSNTNVKADIPSRILELEKNDERGCDVCIQHVLPDSMMYDGRFDLNIGIFEYETSHFRNTDWATYLNMMDQVWVPNTQMVWSCEASGVTQPIFVVPHTFDISRYSQYYKPYPIPELEGKFVFYAMGEFIRRKNMATLLKAFHLEFGINEEVSLLIKTHIMGASPAYVNQAVRQTINEVKRGLRLYPKVEDYHDEILITQWLSDDEIMRLHKTCDCFVLPSYGEAWCIPGFEAMAMGNPTIMTDFGGPHDYIKNFENGVLISGRPEPAFMKPEEVPLPDIWKGNESWYSVDIYELMKQMRYVYENKDCRERISSNGIDTSLQYSFQNVGKAMKGIIETKRKSKICQTQSKQ